MDTTHKRILLVEDDRFLRRACEAGLRQRGFTVLMAVDGEEALQKARAEVPDLILLDLIMPKIHGFEVLRLLKQDPVTASIPVIVMSNLGQDGDIQQAMAAGAIGYLIKTNLWPRDIVKHVEAALAGGQP
jgi:CheY-like chemotaxis protein